MSEYATKYRTHTCGELRIEHVGGSAGGGAAAPEVALTGHLERDGETDRGLTVLCGHVDQVIDPRTALLRDRYGRTLVRVHEEALPYVAERFSKLEREDVVQVKGTVAARERPEAGLETGEVLLEATKVELLSKAEPPPAGLLGAGPVPLDDRLAYRQLYLRRPDMQKRLAFRARVTHEVREYLIGRGFLEVETPQLFWYDKVAPAPEIVPVPGGRAFALSSGPVVLDQYLKPAHYDRTFQLTRITRREANPTPFHAQEHTGLDLNLAYVDVPDFCAVVEGLLKHIFKALLGIELPTPFPKFTHEEALRTFGSDKPDLRITPGGVGDLVDMPDIAPAGQTVRAFLVPAERAEGKDFEALLAGLSGVATVQWTRYVTDQRLEGNGAALFTDRHFHSLRTRSALLSASGAKPGDVIVCAVAPSADAAAAAAGTARSRVARALAIVDESRHELCWVTDYPFLTNDNGNWVPNVVVFSQPVDADLGLVNDPQKRNLVRAKAFDLVMDGHEIASAYIGQHDIDVQRICWQELFQMSTDDLVRVRAPIEAHRFGCPPHGGMNLGFDRLVARLLNLETIDEVMWFPKSPQCRDLLLDAPGPVPAAALAEIVAPAAKPAYTESDLAAEVTKA